MRTFPLGNNVAVCWDLGKTMLPVAVNVPALGSYASALAEAPRPLWTPPATRTFPPGNKVAV
jgi:hypothetical protein